MPAEDATAGRPSLTALSIPGPRSSMQYLRLFCGGLEEADIRAIDVRDAAAWTLRFDVLHLHFPTYYITEASLAVALTWAVMFRLALLACRLLGKRIVYTIHDVTPFRPRRGWLLWPFVAAVHRATHGFVFLSPSSERAFRARFPSEADKPCLRLGIGTFPATVLDAAARRRARAALVGDSDALLVGFLGFHRPRKGLDLAASLPASLPDGRAVVAVVAGEIEADYRPEAERVLRRIPAERLVHIDRPLSDSEIGVLIQAVDVVILPYVTGWNSAMAMLVLSHHQRVLASDLPVFVDFEQALGPPWVATFPRDMAVPLTAAMLAALAPPELEPDAEAGARLSTFLESHRFIEGGRRMRAFYVSLQSRGFRRTGDRDSPAHPL